MKRCLLCCVIYLALYSFGILAMEPEGPEKFVFIGNPGVGKSTLINSLIGKSVAESGVTAGAGLTQFFSIYEHDGKSFMDTPGLADIKIREQAAKEIETALKQGGKYRLFFVLTLLQGRVKPEDVVTINTVMSAINDPNKSFNVIINQLNRKEKREILNDAEKMAEVYQGINSGIHKTNSIWYAEFDRDIDDGLTEFIRIDTGLGDFIYNRSLSFSIAKEKVDKIEVDQFEKIKEMYEQQMLDLKKQLETKDSRFEELIAQMKEAQQQLKQQQIELENARKQGQGSKSTTVVFCCLQ